MSPRPRCSEASGRLQFKRPAAGRGTFRGSCLGSAESFRERQVLEFGCGKKLKFSVQETEPKEQKSEERKSILPPREHSLWGRCLCLSRVRVCVCVCDESR